MHMSKKIWELNGALLQGKDRRKRPDRFYIGKKIIDMKVVLSLWLCSLPPNCSKLFKLSIISKSHRNIKYSK